VFKQIKCFATVAHFITRLKHNHTEYLPIAYITYNITNIAKRSLIKWLVHQKFVMREVSQPAKILLVSHPSLGFLFFFIFHSVNGAIDGLNGV
jgi:hypothetical protein